MEKSANQTTKTYRFKFSTEINEIIQNFAQMHMYDSKDRLKENYDIFWDSNQEIFMREQERLNSDGFQNDMKLSVFRSMKYYYIKKFKSSSENSTNEKNENVRDYIKLNKFIIQYIDMFIINAMRDDSFKPSKNYTILREDKQFKELIQEEKPKIFQKYKKFMSQKQNTEVENDETYDVWWENKIKKTHKNRYFSIKSKR